MDTLVPIRPTSFAPHRSVPAAAPERDARLAPTDRPGVIRPRWPFLALIGLIAGGIRFWRMDATFESSDQAAMAHMVCHSFGLRWIFAHDYGPTLPVLQRAFAEVFAALRIPIGEAAFRLPVALVSMVQVVVTYPFVRRLGASASAAVMATLIAALLPTLLSDGHYAWGYLTLWLFTGTVALWMTLAWMDDRRWHQLATAGVALFLHCLSNVFALGLPVTLLVVWVRWLRSRPHACPGSERAEFDAGMAKKNAGAIGSQPGPPLVRRRPLRAAGLGFIVPCLAAVAVIIVSWRWTGGGQLGRLLLKQARGTTGLQWHQLFELPVLWASQFGYVFGVVAACGLIWGCASVFRRPSARITLPAIWAIVAGAPLVLLTDWQRVGYPASYFIEAVYCAGLLGGLLMGRAFDRPAPRSGVGWGRIALAGGGLAVLGVGSVDACLFGGGLGRLTGVSAPWGAVRADGGAKAVGLYIRRNVPIEAPILYLHDHQGMELPVAQFYSGRYVLACYDLKAEMLPHVVEAMEHDVGVVVLPAGTEATLTHLENFECVCTIRYDQRPLCYIYARRDLGLPKSELSAAEANAAYDAQFRPARVPQPLGISPAVDSASARYRQVVAELKTSLRGSRSVDADPAELSAR